jgi:hypothetical protein
LFAGRNDVFLFHQRLRVAALVSLGALVLAAVLAMDAGFVPVALDVEHADLWLNLPDGGVDDAPRRVLGGVWMDDETTMHVAQEKARLRGEHTVGPDVDLRTVTLVGAVMFTVGVLAGGALVWVLKR